MKELIEEHLRLHFTTSQEEDEQMLGSLPTTLRRRVLRHLYGAQLQRCWLLAGVKPKFFDALLGVARLETFMPQVSAASALAGRMQDWLQGKAALDLTDFVPACLALHVGCVALLRRLRS
jgi:hypothetical protein